MGNGGCVGEGVRSKSNNNLSIDLHGFIVISFGNHEREKSKSITFTFGGRSPEALLKLTLKLLDKGDFHYPCSCCSIQLNKSYRKPAYDAHGAKGIDTNVSKITNIHPI